MAEQKFCQDCNQKHNCQKVYQQLGNTKSPSVILKVVVAFLLPLVVFIAVLATSERILAKTINTKELQTTFSLLLALLVTSALILITRAINKQISKDR